jgi:soluble lytic murein transglycosylase-like protein
MKVFHFMLTALIVCALLGSGIHLTRSYENAKVRLDAEREAVRIALEIKEAKKVKEEKIYNARVRKIVRDIRKVNGRINQENAEEIAEAFIKYGKEYNIRINRLLQIASIESRFDHKAINRESGDYGLMQINWRIWGRQLVSRPKELLDINTNVKYACYILRYNRKIGFERIGNYHSFDPEDANSYEERLEPFVDKFAWNY